VEKKQETILNHLDRRQFLKFAGMAALAATVGGTVARAGILGNPVQAKDNNATSDIAKNQWVMVFDLRRCDGCGHCTDGCSI